MPYPALTSYLLTKAMLALLEQLTSCMHVTLHSQISATTHVHIASICRAFGRDLLQCRQSFVFLFVLWCVQSVQVQNVL